MYSKYERRTDTRTYDDRRKLYEGGWDVLYAELLEKSWKEKMDEWTGRPKSRYLDMIRRLAYRMIIFQQSCRNGSVRGPARSPESPSLPMMRTREQVTLLLAPGTRRRRKKKRRKMNKSMFSVPMFNVDFMNPYNLTIKSISVKTTFMY